MVGGASRRLFQAVHRLAAARIQAAFLPYSFFLEDACLGVAAKASRPVEDGVGSVGILAQLHPRLDEMGAQRLPDHSPGVAPVERHAFVIADLPFLLNAQNLVELDAGYGSCPGTASQSNITSGPNNSLAIGSLIARRNCYSAASPRMSPPKWGVRGGQRLR